MVLSNARIGPSVLVAEGAFSLRFAGSLELGSDVDFAAIAVRLLPSSFVEIGVVLGHVVRVPRIFVERRMDLMAASKDAWPSFLDSWLLHSRSDDAAIALSCGNAVLDPVLIELHGFLFGEMALNHEDHWRGQLFRLLARRRRCLVHWYVFPWAAYSSSRRMFPYTRMTGRRRIRRASPSSAQNSATCSLQPAVGGMRSDRSSSGRWEPRPRAPPPRQGECLWTAAAEDRRQSSFAVRPPGPRVIFPQHQPPPGQACAQRLRPFCLAMFQLQKKPRDVDSSICGRIYR